jgi:hypothetical protein
MFLDFPIELQYIIYDKLFILDRINLNIALVKNALTRDNDKKLYIILHAFKETETYKPTQSTKIMKFIEQNYDDPTIQFIIQNYNIKVDIPDFNKLINMIIANNIKDLDKIQNIDLNHMPIISDLKHVLGMHATPDTFDIISTKYPIILGVHHVYGMIFNCINFKNEILLEYLVNKSPESVIYIQNPEICDIFALNIDMLELLTKYIKLPKESIDSIKKQSVKYLKFDILDFIRKIM